MCPRPLFALVAALGFLATTAGAEPGPTVVTDALIAPYFTARSAPAELRRAWRKLQAGRTKDARRRFARFLDRKPDHPMAGASGFLLGALLLEADDRAAAIDRFSAAAERWPLMADDARFRAANAALEIGDYARTQALCRAIPMASPWGPESRYLRGRALVLEDDPAARASGIALLEQLVADPAGAGDRDRIALSLARAYEQGERHADAGRVFDRLARENAGAWLGRKAASGLARLAPHLGAAVRRVVGAPTVAAHLAKAQSLLRRHRSDEVLSEDGWFNTGDLGMLTVNNELKLVGRVKDTIVLLGGENIEPAPIEQKLKESFYIEQAVALGQDQKYIAALIVPRREDTEQYAQKNNISYVDWEGLVETSEINELLANEISTLVSAQNGFKNIERVYRFKLMPDSFEVGKQLSHKQEVMRHVINQMYHREIEKLFE